MSDVLNTAPARSAPHVPPGIDPRRWLAGSPPLCAVAFAVSIGTTISIWSQIDHPIHSDLVLVMGLVVSLFVAALTWQLLHVRTRALRLADGMTLELKASKERYRRLFEDSNVTMLVIDPSDGRIVDANKTAVAYYGHPLPTLLAMKISDINTLSPEEVKAEMRRARELSKAHFEFRHRLADGRARDVEVSSGPIEIDGRTMLLSQIRDVTERKAAEEQVRTLNRDFVALLENTTDFIFFRDRDRHFRFCSQTMAALLGHRDWRDCTGRHTREVFPDAIGPAYFEDEGPLFERGIPVLNRTYPYQDREGRPGWVSSNRWPVFGEDGKTVIGLFGINRDVTEQKQAQDALQASERRFRSIIEASPVPFALIDANGHLSFLNESFVKTFGFTREEIPTVGRWWHLALPDPDYRENMTRTWTQRLEQARAGERPFEALELAIHCRDGGRRTVLASAAPIDDSRQRDILLIFYDITPMVQAETRMREALVVFNSSSEGIMMTDSEGVISAVNPAFTTITGYTAEEVRGRKPSLLKSGRHDEAFYADLWGSFSRAGSWEGEIWDRRKNGEVYPQWTTISAIRDPQNRIIGYVALLTDITQRKQQEEAIWRQANFDRLTGLANRNLLHDRLERAIAHAHRNRLKVGLMFIDLDGFKGINDTLGHDVGDELLVEVARRLRGSVRAEDTVARLGGDEFTLVMHELTDKEALRPIGEKVLNALREPFLLADHLHRLSGSIGVTVYPDDGEDVQTLLKNADIAMYRSKNTGKNRVHFFTPSMQADALPKLKLETELNVALEQNAFVLHYQPIVTATSGAVVGVEALIRWQHPTRGLLSPREFLPVAEESGLIVGIGDWVLREALREWGALQARAGALAGQEGTTTGGPLAVRVGDDPPPLRMGVNVSAAQFRQTDVPGLVSGLLEDYGLAPEGLVLEIKEPVLLEGRSAVDVRRLRERGLRCSLDDFGTGLSSISHLKRYPIDYVKLDQSILNDCPVDQNEAELIKALIRLAHSLGVKVVAEGVETETQLQVLREMGCDYVQGRVISPPLTALELEAFLAPGGVYGRTGGDARRD